MDHKSEHDISKEKLENEILNRATELSLNKRKITRDILAMMQGKTIERDKNDNPDIVKIYDGDNGQCIFGIEHFLVEQVSVRKKGKRTSVVQEKKAYIEKTIEKIKNEDDHSIVKKASEEIMTVVFDIASKTNTTGIKELKESFCVTLDKHLSNANIYTENLKKIADGKPIKLAFLIEIRTNASDVFLNNGRTMKRKKNDIYPLFNWMVYELEKIDPQMVEYVVLYMRHSLNKDKEDVLAIDTTNIRGCLRKQGIIAYEFCDDPAKVEFPNEGFSQNGLEYSVNIQNKDRYSLDVFPVLQQAYDFKQKGIPFVAPRSIQAMIYAYGKQGCRIVSSTLIPKHGNIIEVVRRFDEFVAQYPVDKKKKD